MITVFDSMVQLECPSCTWYDDYYDCDDTCADCKAGRYLYHRIYVETEDTDPKEHPGLSCVVMLYAPSWTDPVDGQELTHGRYDKATTRVARFDFTITSDDSDVAVFEPHIDAIRKILPLSRIDELRTQAVVASRVKKGTPVASKIDTAKILAECEAGVISRVRIRDKRLLRWIQPISKTFVNAAYAISVAPVTATMAAAGGAGDKKPCPHVGRR